MIGSQVANDPAEPAPEPLGVAQLIQPLPDAHKRLLRHIPRRGCVSDNCIRHRQRAALVPSHQSRKRRLISAPCPLNIFPRRLLQASLQPMNPATTILTFLTAQI
jgi:hypothetical protein